MQIPDELKRMLGRLDCNAEYLVALPQQLVIRAARTSSVAQRRVVATFLDTLLSGPTSYDDLLQVWFSGPIEILPKDEAYLRNFFELLRRELDNLPPPKLELDLH